MLPLFIGLAALQAGEGLYSTIKGNNALDELHKNPFLLEKETPEMAAARARAEMNAAHGLSGAETSAFQNRLAQGQNLAYTRAVDASGGNLASAVSKGLNIQNTGGQVDFAAKDAALHRQNIQYADSLTKNVQRIADDNIRAQQRNRLMAEQALGTGIANSRDRLMGAGNTLIASSVLGGKTTDPNATGVPKGLDWFQQMLNPGRHTAPYKDEGVNATPYASEVSPTDMTTNEQPANPLDVLSALYGRSNPLTVPQIPSYLMKPQSILSTNE